MIIKLRNWKTADKGIVRALDVLCFPAPDLGFRNNAWCHWWVAGDERNAPIGYCGIEMQKGRVAELLRIGVVPDMKKRGIAGKLLKRVESWCRRRGVVKIKTYCAVENTASRALFKKAGYRSRRSKCRNWVHFAKDLK